MYDPNEDLDLLEKAKEPREHNLIKRYLKAPKSRAKAIQAQCFHCLGGDENNMPDSGWREDIRECGCRPDSKPGNQCYLWEFRPFK